MVDVVDKATRSRMMSGIRARDTKPERILRKALFGRGFRYRLHNGHLPGRPDIVLVKHKAVVFVNGCFWHGHGCYLFKWPKSHATFWSKKIRGNRLKDRKVLRKLEKLNWRVAVVWECVLKGRHARSVDILAERLDRWLYSRRKFIEIDGKSPLATKHQRHVHG